MRTESLFYDIDCLSEFKQAIKTAEERNRVFNDSIEIKEYENDFEVIISPTILGFLADVFVEFGKNLSK